MMKIVYNTPEQAPSGISVVIDCLNASGDLAFEVIDIPGLRNATSQQFAAGSENIMSVTPDPRVALSWHRNTVDSTSAVYIEVAEVVRDHYGNAKPVVTGWSMGQDGRAHAFACTPMTPQHPGGKGISNYDQQNKLVQEFVEAAQSMIGRLCRLRQNGWGSSLPVTIGRVALQVSGLTAAELQDWDGNVLYNEADHTFEIDPPGTERPEARKRGQARTRGSNFWPVLTDQKLCSLRAAAKGESPMADNGSEDMETFLASVTAS